jgi:hypothetical protein
MPSVPQLNFGSFGPKTTTSDLWNKTRTHFAGTGSTQNPVEKKGFIPDFQSGGRFPATVFFSIDNTQRYYYYYHHHHSYCQLLL